MEQTVYWVHTREASLFIHVLLPVLQIFLQSFVSLLRLSHLQGIDPLFRYDEFYLE